MALLYTIEEAAGILGISPGELKAKAQAREIPAILFSGTWRLRVDDVNELARRRGERGVAKGAPSVASPAARAATAPPPPADRAAPPPEPAAPAVPPLPAAPIVPPLPAAPVEAPMAVPVVAPVAAEAVAAPAAPPPLAPIASPAPLAAVGPSAPAREPSPPPPPTAAPPPRTVAPAARAPVARPLVGDGEPATEAPPTPPPVSAPSYVPAAATGGAMPPPSAFPSPSWESGIRPDPFRDVDLSAPAEAPAAAPERPAPSFSHVDELGFALDLELPAGMESFDAPDAPPARQEVISVDDLGFTVAVELPEPTVSPEGAGAGVGHAAAGAPAAADVAAEEEEEEPEDEFLGIPSEREPDSSRAAVIPVQCPNPSCMAPGTVREDQLDRPMTCKVCGTDFYYDREAGRFVLGVHPEGKRSKATRIYPTLTAATATATVGSRPWRKKKSRWKLWVGAAAAALVVAIASQLDLLTWAPNLPNQVQDRARYLAKAVARDETSSIRALSDRSTRSDVGAWLRKVRPASWPPTDEGVKVEVDLSFVHPGARDALCRVDIGRPTGAAAKGKGGGDAVIRPLMYWIYSKDNQWLFDATRSLKAANGQDVSRRRRAARR